MKIASGKIGVFSLILLLVFLAGKTVTGAEVSGRYTMGYEDREVRDGSRESVMVNYLSFEAKRLPVTNLSVHGFSKYAYEWQRGDSATGIYYLYGNHRTFEGRNDLLFGRFPLESHRFLTLDGVHFTQRPNRPFGYSLYLGQPRYMEIHDDRFERQFRDSGDYLAGGKIFLRGVEGVRANASYSREGGGGDVYREIIGVGGGKDYYFTRRQEERDEVIVAVDGSLDYNPDQSAVDRLSARLFVIYPPRLRVVLQADRYDVRDNYPADRELIITLFSTGREDRAKYTVTYDWRPEIAFYQSSVFTELEMPDGAWRRGRIVKGGVIGDYRESRGVLFDAGLYHFNSHLSEANGLALSVDYQYDQVWNLLVGLELVRLSKPLRDEKNARSVNVELGYKPGDRWKLAGYLERSDNPEYRNDFRVGLRFDYLFGFALGRAAQRVGP
ncbi:hypothetical protein [Desulfurivibrio alkaliphilus]|uniref:Uncharacterized protein n=1 Tax=Desulfurivibrio alkaliphilus (strain DSM 19089 / UNIQEM U267 / AHT2) TaxID=589865 RepID=D6Z5P5_DESAT|nr:hypothetical protein [Desulfurivibrio alkaliphilus]ADH86782.1 hypothetical protein DaAHT2_2111 [Desulfurivibrio alkaliphilus AHT 2]